MKNKRMICIAVLVVSLLIDCLRPGMVADVPRVALGVTLAGKNIEGFSEAELKEYLKDRASELSIAPLQPIYDQRPNGVIPGLAGRELDVEVTLAICLAAPPNTENVYVFRAVLPDLPSLSVPIYRGNAAKKQIAFVINVAWGNDELMELLEILDAHKLKKTFFLVGRWATKYPELVREIARRGHEFGNHAYSDLHLSRQNPEKVREEIIRTTEAIVRAVGPVAIRFFSPPYNDFNQEVVNMAASLGYQTVLCSLDTADWMRLGADRIVQRIVPRAHNGAIVLMHPTGDTPSALRVMISKLQEMGYRLVKLSELFSPLVE